MGVIQQAINQGITAASIIGQMQGVPEIRKGKKELEKSLDRGIKEQEREATQRKQQLENIGKSGDLKGDFQKQLKYEEGALLRKKERSEALQGKAKSLFEQTGKEGYLDLADIFKSQYESAEASSKSLIKELKGYLGKSDTDAEIGKQANRRAQKTKKERKEQYIQTSIGKLPASLVAQAEDIRNE